MIFAYNFDLKYSLILEKLPYLAGIRLDPNGFILGAALTLYLSVISIVAAAVLYWIIAVVLEIFQVHIERYYGKGFVREKEQTA